MQNSFTTAAYYNWYEDQPTNTDAEDCVFMVGVDHGSKKKSLVCCINVCQGDRTEYNLQWHDSSCYEDFEYHDFGVHGLCEMADGDSCN